MANNPKALFRIGLPEGTFELTGLTRSMLAHFKQWYGEQYGQRVMFIQKVILQDADAVACAIWAVRKQEGITPNPDPKNMPDFDPDDVLLAFEEEEESTEPPLGPPAVTKTSEPSGSTEETPTSSGVDGSQ